MQCAVLRLADPEETTTKKIQKRKKKPTKQRAVSVAKKKEGDITNYMSYGLNKNMGGLKESNNVSKTTTEQHGDLIFLYAQVFKQVLDFCLISRCPYCLAHPAATKSKKPAKTNP